MRRNSHYSTLFISIILLWTMVNGLTPAIPLEDLIEEASGEGPSSIGQAASSLPKQSTSAEIEQAVAVSPIIPKNKTDEVEVKKVIPAKEVVITSEKLAPAADNRRRNNSRSNESSIELALEHAAEIDPEQLHDFDKPYYRPNFEPQPIDRYSYRSSHEDNYRSRDDGRYHSQQYDNEYRGPIYADNSGEPIIPYHKGYTIGGGGGGDYHSSRQRDRRNNGGYHTAYDFFYGSDSNEKVMVVERANSKSRENHRRSKSNRRRVLLKKPTYLRLKSEHREHGRGELDLTSRDIAVFHQWIEKGRWYYLFSFVEELLYKKLSRKRQSELHSFAGLLSPKDDWKLWKLLQARNFHDIYKFIDKKFESHDHKDKSLRQLYLAFKALFGEDLAKHPSKHNNQYSVQASIVAITLILW